MGVKELLGFESERRVRYAIVGLGDIAQEDRMPGVEHTENSEITARYGNALRIQNAEDRKKESEFK